MKPETPPNDFPPALQQISGPSPEVPLSPSPITPTPAELLEETRRTAGPPLFGAQIQMRQGPLPSPEDIAGYAAINPTYPDRIFAMAEAAQKHVQEMQRADLQRVINGERGGRTERRIGQICGLTIAVIGLGVAAVLALYDHDAVAGVIGGTTVVGLSTAFIVGRVAQQKKSAESKR